jgi:glycerol-3-phosphate dehydrogenase
MAHDALRSAQYCPTFPLQRQERVRCDRLTPIEQLDPIAQARLSGRYGVDTPALIEAAKADELQAIGASPARWAELRWAARSEGVVHLDDLLLRRVRLGILAPQGGLPLLDRIRAIARRNWAGTTNAGT